MNDTIVYVVNKIEPRRYGEMIKANFDRLYAEGKDNGVVMCVPLHAYQVSHPHRLKAFEEALEYITGHSDVWVTTGREIAEYYIDNCYDAAVADIEIQFETVVALVCFRGVLGSLLGFLLARFFGHVVLR